MTQFLKLETLLDDSVNKKVEMEIERGGTPMTVNLTVSSQFTNFLPYQAYYVLL